MWETTKRPFGYRIVDVTPGRIGESELAEPMEESVTVAAEGVNPRGGTYKSLYYRRDGRWGRRPIHL